MSRTFVTPRGRFELRPERPEDGAFLFKLFRDHNVRILRFAQVSEAEVENLVAMQFKSQTKTYKSLYPETAFSIVACDGENVGRIVEHDEGDVIYVADIIFRPELQGRGLGSALIGALQPQWAARGRGGRAMVMSGNIPSLKMWSKAGFRGELMADEVHYDMRWYPPGHKKHVAKSQDLAAIARMPRTG